MRRTFASRRRAAIAAAGSLAVAVAVGAQPAGAAPEAAAPPPARTMTLAECVAVAVRQNPDALTRDADVAAAEADRAGVRGAFGPKLSASGALLYNSSMSIAFDGSGFTLPSALTASVGVSLSEPLTPLFAIYDQYKIRDLGVDVASIERVASRREIALRTIEAYYGVLEAVRLSAVADDSVIELEAQERQARSQFTNGVIGKNDLLRASLALASARQRAIQMRGQVQIARGRLATEMGLPIDRPIEPAPVTGELPSREEATIEGAEQRALARRVELRALDQRIEQARGGVRFAKKKLVPAVSAMGGFMLFGGTQFKEADVFYGGVTASWDVWDWGTTLSGIDKASAQVNQALAARAKLADTVQGEARQAFVNAETSRQALDVARAAVSQAEENYRIVTKKFDANAATSFDVVDAEAQLTDARGHVETALYDALVAHAALEKATGAPLPGGQ